MACILAYDLGTSSVKASLFDETGLSLAHAVAEYPLCCPASGIREQRPDDLWDGILRATRSLTEQRGDLIPTVAAIGISGHSLGVIPIDGEGRVLCDATPIWSDERAEAQAADFFRTVSEKTWYETTGNGFPAHLYSIFKIMWYRDHAPEVYNQAAAFLGTKDYINYRLTGAAATDHSYASGSGVYDLRKHGYRADYLAAAGIPAEKLPEILPSHGIVGHLTPGAAGLLGLPAGIPVAAGGVDNACMSLGAGCIGDGDAYASLGTSAWVAASTKEPVLSYEKRPYVWAHCIDGLYVPNMGIFSSGSSLQWVMDHLFGDLAGRADRYDAFYELVQAAPAGAHRLFFNPCLAGGNHLDKSSHLRGGFAGLDLSHTRADVARATVEGMAFHLKLAWDVLSRHVHAREMLLVGGGATAPAARQIYADIFHMDMVKTDILRDATSLGAAAVAAYGVGLWPDYTPIRAAHRNRQVTAPDPADAAVYEQLLPLYAAVSDHQSEIGELMRSPDD